MKQARESMHMSIKDHARMVRNAWLKLSMIADPGYRCATAAQSIRSLDGVLILLLYNQIPCLPFPARACKQLQTVSQCPSQDLLVIHVRFLLHVSLNDSYSGCTAAVRSDYRSDVGVQVEHAGL
jgi:hypothetical protein